MDLIWNDIASLPYNLTFVAEEVFIVMRYYLFDDWDNTPRNQRHYGSWRNRYNVKFAVIPTRYGFCLSFNIADPNRFLELEM